MNVVIPYFTAGALKLEEWLVPDGAHVNEGDSICFVRVFEDDDALFELVSVEISAPASGRLKQHGLPGRPVDFDRPIGQIK